MMCDYAPPHSYFDPPENSREVRCPICGHETDTVYMDGDRDIVGCDHCLTRKEVDHDEDFICPVCGNRVSPEYEINVYLDWRGGIIGCDECITSEDYDGEADEW